MKYGKSVALFLLGAACYVTFFAALLFTWSR